MERALELEACFNDVLENSQTVKAGMGKLIRRYGELTEETYSDAFRALLRETGVDLTHEELKFLLHRRINRLCESLTLGDKSGKAK